MQTLESLRQRIKKTQELRSVVQTMKSLATVSIRHYERAATALEEYNRVVEMGLHIVLHNRPSGISVGQEASHERLGAVILGSDQGMCGQFNERLVGYAVDRMNGMQIRRENRFILAVGLRARARLEEAEQPIERAFFCPSSVAGITAHVQELLFHIDDWRSRQHVEQIVLFYNRQHDGAAYHPHTTYLLPLNLSWLRELETAEWNSRVLPTFRMEWEAVFAALVREHFFVSLYRAFAHSLASENAARLAAMQTADRNIEEKLEELNGRYQRRRQDTITAELLDIVSGFEALTGAGSSHLSAGR